MIRTARRFFNVVGFELVDYRPRCMDIKDRALYRPMFNPWLSPEWKRRLRGDDPRSLVPLDAKYNLYCLAKDATQRCNGDVCECGVYKGGTAKLLAELVQDRPIYLFDTFAGMPETDAEKDWYKAGVFNDTSIEAVQEYLAGHSNVHCIAGLIPESLKPVESRQFAFVHIDLDIYSAITSACEFFYKRMQPGGVLLFDDYGNSTCPGARAAVDDFFADKPETLFVMDTAQCVIQKH